MSGEDAFGGSAPFSLGVEEECFLVDPVSGAQANASAEVLARVRTTKGSVAAELHACQVELITEICSDAGEAVAMLDDLRRAVRATGAGMIGSGTHPAALEGEAEITDKTRYERIHDLLGDAVATPVAGLHVHVGMPDRETAIRAFNALRAYLPLLAALAANSPFRHRRDTGLASARDMTIRSWPRSGVPPAMDDYEAFCATTERLTRAANVPDYTWFWWKLRPHPRLGTVEIRALDTQCVGEHTLGLVALTHCLARHAAEAAPAPALPPEILEEAIFRAARYGVDADLPDGEGNLRPVRQLLSEALSIAARYANELNCAEALDGVPLLLEQGGGAGIQRRAHAIAGMDALLRDLLRLNATAPADAQP
ncbi:MAG TPA: YbdK family carboxylate-amine ligase [Solirubrobacteraceae bacterium]